MSGVGDLSLLLRADLAGLSITLDDVAIDLETDVLHSSPDELLSAFDEPRVVDAPDSELMLICNCSTGTLALVFILTGMYAGATGTDCGLRLM